MAAGQDKTAKLKSQTLLTIAEACKPTSSTQPSPKESHNARSRADTCKLTTQWGEHPADPVMMNSAKSMDKWGGEGGRDKEKEKMKVTGKNRTFRIREF
jgi:hypothetical protein